MNEYININGGEFIHLSMVKRIREITPEDRKWLSERGPHVKPDEFNTRIEQTNGSRPLARETVEDLSAQGIALVETEAGAYIPKVNIKHVKDITDGDRKSFKERTGNPMRDDYKSQIESTTGKVLSTVDGSTIMRRMSKGNQREAFSKAAPQKTLAAQRNEVMAKAATPKKKAPVSERKHAPEQ